MTRSIQGSAVADKLARRAASRRKCCKRVRWTLGVTCSSYAEIFGITKIESLGVVCVILYLAVSVEHHLWQTDGRTDRQTDRHTSTANTRASYRHACKNRPYSLKNAHLREIPWNPRFFYLFDVFIVTFLWRFFWLLPIRTFLCKLRRSLRGTLQRTQVSDWRVLLPTLTQQIGWLVWWATMINLLYYTCRTIYHFFR